MRISGTILSMMAFLMASCAGVGMTDVPFTTISLSISTELTVETKAEVIDSETAVDDVFFAVFSKDDGSCIWSGDGDGAEFSCRKGTSLRIIALCNYHDLIDVPKPGESMATLDNETLEWDKVKKIIYNSEVIPMYGETELIPVMNQESVSIVVNRICNKILITGTVRASGEVNEEGVDFEGPDRLAAMLDHSPSVIHLDGTPDAGCEELPGQELSPDLCADLAGNESVGAYFPAGQDNALVLQFEFENMTWHYPVSLGGSKTNMEYNIYGITIGRFIDWDEEWLRNDIGIKISGWKQNHSINETI